MSRDTHNSRPDPIILEAIAYMLGVILAGPQASESGDFYSVNPQDS